MPAKQASTYDEIRPLIELCKAGKLFEVEDWIAAGKPVNPPPPPPKKSRPRTPLQYALDAGFHSLVQVLLEGGAEIESSYRYCSLGHAVGLRRLDLARLLVEHGADVKAVALYDVFHSWQPEMVEYFIEQGADLETGNPLAQAFCSKIFPALRVFKRYQERVPGLQEQANIALRYHCREGNAKWIALMLWAGADPYAKGPDDPEGAPDPEGDHCALENAAFYGHGEVFGMKRIRLDPTHRHAYDLVRSACYAESAEILAKLLKLGFPVNDQANGGSSLIELLLIGMAWSFYPYMTDRDRNVDHPRAREKTKMLHLLVKHGARWIPDEHSNLRRIRRELCRLSADYALELVWMMSKYGGCQRPVIESLLRTPAIRAHLALHMSRVDELVERLPMPDTPNVIR